MSSLSIGHMNAGCRGRIQQWRSLSTVPANLLTFGSASLAGSRFCPAANSNPSLLTTCYSGRVRSSMTCRSGGLTATAGHPPAAHLGVPKARRIASPVPAAPRLYRHVLSCLNGRELTRKASMKRQEVSVLITDLDDTLYSWFQVWFQSFNALLERLVDESGVPRLMASAILRCSCR